MNATATETREDLLQRFRPLAESSSRAFLHAHRCLERNEVLNVALAALWSATERYRGDPSFVVYARTVIRRELCEHLAFVSGVSRYEARAAKRVREAIEELRSRLGRVPRDDEIAALLGVSASRFAQSFARFVDGVSPARLTTEIAGEHDVVRENAEMGDHRQMLREAVERLPRGQRSLIQEHYENGATFEQMAAERGVSPGAVHHALSRVLNNLRANFQK